MCWLWKKNYLAFRTKIMISCRWLLVFATHKVKQVTLLSRTECFTTIYWSLNYTTLTMKIILMAYTIQKICFMAFRKSNYLNGRWGWSNDEALCQKVPSVSPPCHAQVTLWRQNSVIWHWEVAWWVVRLTWEMQIKIAHLSELQICSWNVTMS